jgi:hypothetical protein
MKSPSGKVQLLRFASCEAVGAPCNTPRPYLAGLNSTMTELGSKASCKLVYIFRRPSNDELYLSISL